jgi:hypothetical protein
MTVRTLPAHRTGPLLIDAQLLDVAGTVTLRTDPDCTLGHLILRTADDSGPAADAVHGAELRWDPRGALIARVQGAPGSPAPRTQVNDASGVFIAGDLHGPLVINTGSPTTPAALLAAARTSATGVGSTGVEILAVVPESSSLTARTTSADVRAEGVLSAISVNTQSGDIHSTGTTQTLSATTRSGALDVRDALHLVARTSNGHVRIGRTEHADARTVSGDLTVEELRGTGSLASTAGSIRVHATTGGVLAATTTVGDITITASPTALDAGLTIRHHTTTGKVELPDPPQRPGTGSGHHPA